MQKENLARTMILTLQVNSFRNNSRYNLVFLLGKVKLRDQIGSLNQSF